MKKLVAALFLLGCVGHAFADDIKVGVVDLHAVFDKSPQPKKINDDLKKKFAPQEQKIKKAQEGVQSDIKKLQRDNSVMTEAERKKLQEKILKNREELQQMTIDFQQKAAAEQGKAMQKLLDQIKAAIKQVAAKDKLNLVLQSESAPYYDDKLDVTDQVVSVLAK